MFLSGPDDQEEREPGAPEPGVPGPGAPGTSGPEPGVPGPGAGGEGAASWPASGLPPSFGQRSAAGEPAADWYRPLGSLPPSGPLPPEAAERGPRQPAALGQPPAPGQPPARDQPSAADQPEPGVAGGPQAAFSPWETNETEEGYGWTGGYRWTGGYGMVPDQPEAQGYDTGTSNGANGRDPGDGAYAADLPVEPHGSPAAPGIPAAGIPLPGTAAPGTAAPGTAVPRTAASGGEAPPGHEEQLEPGHRPAWQAESADSLTTDLLLPGRHAGPWAGWRGALLRITGGLVRAPQSAAERRKDLIARARTATAGGHHRVAVLSLKGGVGKTTTTVGLGATLASLRGDRIIAVDANPDRGTLSDKFRLDTAATVRDLLNEEDQIHRYADVRAYTTQAASGLEVLASDRDPTVSVAFSAQ